MGSIAMDAADSGRRPPSTDPGVPAIERREEIPLSRLAAVCSLFFVTGATGLIYEVLWTRQLIYIFGATIYAVSTVLTAYMGGLALGSWLFGRWADSRRRPLLLYGVLEILVGAAALAFRGAVRALDPLFQAMYDGLQANFLLFSLIRFAVIFVLLLAPTTLMGATLPVLSRYLTRRSESVGLRIGALYAINTFGAVTGCFLAGFFFIEALGLRKTTWLAVSLNSLVGLLAIYLGRRSEPLAPARALADAHAHSAIADSQSTIDNPQSTIAKTNSEIGHRLSAVSSPAIPRWVSTAVLWSYGLSGGIALAYQVLWSRALVFSMEVLKNTTYAFTAMLTVFLIGLALGSAIVTRVADRQRHPLRLYSLIQILIGLGGALSFYMLLVRARNLELLDYLNWERGRILWIGAVVNVFYKTFAGIFAPTLLMGMAFPVAARLYVGDIRRIGGEVGRLYAFNTVGAIFGSFLGGFVLIPALGMGRSIMALAILNVAIGAILLSVDPTAGLKARRGWGLAGLIVITLLLLRFPSRDEPFQKIEDYQKMVFYKEGPLATVSVVRNLLGHHTIYVDNVGVAGTDPILLTDQKSLAHLPVLFLENPRSALTVGFGSGGASHSYCLHKFMTKIHCAEICETVLDAAPTLQASNHGIITLDPGHPGRFVVREDARGRYDIKLDDVRSYLRFTRERYDIIATDCTDLQYKSNANLYDLEYFQLCAGRITDDGMVVVWMPLGGLSDAAFRVALRTFYRVFPKHTSVWYMNNEPTHYILLIGMKKPLRIDVARMKERLSDPEVSKDLAEIGLNDPDKLLSCYVLDERKLDRFLADGPLNTEDYPYLEFEAPRYGFGDRPLLDNLSRLWEKRNDIEPYLVNWEGSNGGPAADRLRRYREAADWILKGHAAFRNLLVEEAARDYVKARQVCPEDKSIARLLDFGEIQLRVLNSRNDLWGYTKLGRALMIQGRYAEAYDKLSYAAFLKPTDDGSKTQLALHREAVESLKECQDKMGGEQVSGK